MAFRTLAAAFVLFIACTADSPSASDRITPSPTAADVITVGSFEFAESELLAELYSQALEGGGFTVRRSFNLGPRELVAPALARGLVDLVPEYAGTALQFLSLGRAEPAADPAATREALAGALKDAGVGVTALEPAPAQDANAFVVTRATADRLGLQRLSDLAGGGPNLTLGGPPECATRPLCAVGLDRVYGARFKEVVALDAGGPLTLQALRAGAIDVALLFTTDPAISDRTLVQLADDRALQPAENVVPLVRTEVVAKGGARLVELIDAVSRRLTTDGLRGLNQLVAEGDEVPGVAATWLASEGSR